MNAYQIDQIDETEPEAPWNSSRPDFRKMEETR